MLDYTVPTNASPHKSGGGIRLSMILPAFSSPSAARMLSQPSTPVHEHSPANDVVSAGKCIIVHHFQPKTALVSVSELLAINFTYTDDVTSDASLVQLRLNVAGEYIPASVRSGPNNTLNMHAVVPSKTLSQSGQSLQLSVHAFRNGHLFDACDFGELIVEGEGRKSSSSGSEHHTESLILQMTYLHPARPLDPRALSGLSGPATTMSPQSTTPTTNLSLQLPQRSSESSTRLSKWPRRRRRGPRIFSPLTLWNCIL